MRAVEDAIARQVFHGGDLATNLLEVAAVREESLVPILAENVGLPPAPLGRLPLPPPEVLRLVPGELALRHGIFPLALDDRALVVAVAEPLPPAVEDDLGFALDLAIKQELAPLVRIRQAIADAHGIALDRRFLRLVAKLDGQADPFPSAAPPPERDLLPGRMPRPISIPSPSFSSGVPSDIGRLLEEKPTTKTPYVAAHEFVNPSIPKSPALPAEAEVEARPEGRAALAPPPPPPPPPAEPPAASHKLPGATRALASVVQKALREERASAPVDKTKRDRPAWRPAAPRRRGPFTAAMAERELEEATASDQALGIVFDFALQFFEYTALFVVHGDLAEGRESHGPGADRARVAALGVPLDLPSSLAKARDVRGPVIGKLSAEGLDADLLRDLERGPRQPSRAAALLPVVVRSRAVAMIYGDDGAADVELSSLGEVVALLGLAGAALERLALRKKLGGRAPEVPLKVRIQDQPVTDRATAASALARALTSAAEVVTPAPPPVAPAAAARDGVSTFSAHIEASDRPIVVPGPTAPGAGGVYRAPLPAAEDENPLAVAPPPRTARYFDDPSPAKRPTDPGLGIGGIAFPEPAEEDEITLAPAPVVDVGSVPQAPPPEDEPFSLPADSPPRDDTPLPRPVMHLSFDDVGEPESVSDPPPSPAAITEKTPAASPVRTGPGVRRGPAPLYEGRSAAVPEGASVEWVSDEEMPRERSKTLPSFGFEPLPRTPPPNATAWTSFPSPPPPPSLGSLAGQRMRSERPIPREEIESDRASSSPQPPPVLPSVMVDVGAEHKELIQRLIDGGRAGHEAFDELVRHGEQVVQAVMARFPGPLRVDRHRARAELPAASQCGPILELVVAIRRPALPFVSVRSSSPDPEVRFWASHVLGELRYPEAASVLVPRLFDDDASVRRIARRSSAALVSAGAAGAPILKGLEDITKNPDQPVPHRVMAIETMGEIRAGSMVPPLLGALTDGSEDVADAARRALLLLTRQDFGRDVRRWQEWWARNGAAHRIEWLIDALMHEQPGVRRAAGDELKQLTKEYFGYYDDLPKRERERAQGLYRAWWDREGRGRFT